MILNGMKVAKAGRPCNIIRAVEDVPHALTIMDERIHHRIIRRSNWMNIKNWWRSGCEGWALHSMQECMH